MAEYDIIKTTLITENFTHIFEYKIQNVKFKDGVYIVLLKIPQGSNEIDNVYGLNNEGTIIWRIQSVKIAFEISQNTPYISLDIDEDDNLHVTNFYGMRYYVDHIDGTLTKKKCIRW